MGNLLPYQRPSPRLLVCPPSHAYLNPPVHDQGPICRCRLACLSPPVCCLRLHFKVQWSLVSKLRPIPLADVCQNLCPTPLVEV